MENIFPNSLFLFFILISFKLLLYCLFSEETINCINIGQTHKDIYPQIKRPFRKVPVIKVKFTNEEIDKIIWYIQNTSLSYREIARRYNVEHNTILAIKNGRGAYRRPDLSYPLRPNN